MRQTLSGIYMVNISHFLGIFILFDNLEGKSRISLVRMWKCYLYLKIGIEVFDWILQNVHDFVIKQEFKGILSFQRNYIIGYAFMSRLSAMFEMYCHQFYGTKSNWGILIYYIWNRSELIWGIIFRMSYNLYRFLEPSNSGSLSRGGASLRFLL